MSLVHVGVAKPSVHAAIDTVMVILSLLGVFGATFIPGINTLLFVFYQEPLNDRRLPPEVGLWVWYAYLSVISWRQRRRCLRRLAGIDE